MEEQLNILKTDFSIVKENINSIVSNSTSIKIKIEKLRNVYSNMIQMNSYKKIFLFCLESFNFQIKSFSVDSENLNKSLLLLSNRIFCDYYKLFKLIKTLFDESKYSIPSEIINPPIYDVLNPFFEYSVDDISRMHNDVCLLLNSLIDYYNNNCDNIQTYTSKSQSGICITNFIKTLEYDNSVLKDQIFLYLNYMDFFKTTQIKHLLKLLGKMELLKKEINDEITDDIEQSLSEPEKVPVVVQEKSDAPFMIIDSDSVSSNGDSTSDSASASDYSYIELTSPVRNHRSGTNASLSDMSDAASATSSTSLISSVKNDSTILTTSTEKKNEKFVEQNVEEKPVKKRGRPKTKEDAKTKLDKKKEATDSEEFGITIDQINEHANTMSFVIVENADE